MTGLLSKIAIACATVLYGGLKLVLPRRRKVVFLSRQSDTPSRDFSMLVEELRAIDLDLDIVVRTRQVREGFAAKVAYLVEVVAQMRHLADASACIVDGYIVPVSVLEHRPELLVVQTWHALGAVKKFGYQALDQPSGRPAALARAMKMHRNYDVVLCGGPASVPIFAEAFGVDPYIVRPLGLPRVDDLLARADDTFQTSRSGGVRRLVDRFPRLLDEDKAVILYAPTFRKGKPNGWREVVDAFPSDRYSVVVKPHDLDDSSLVAEHAVDARGVDIIELLPLCDFVVTDYSAVVFEALVLGKPVYFYVYDLDEYEQTTGLNVNPRSELPDQTSQDINEIAARIESGVYNDEAARSFARRYVPQSGGCTRAIADLVARGIDAERGV